ncbi:DUF2147 domain-containing protein [Pseudopedobacter beijingensis]|uniref:DUF2147 domain-containing protein n=1 Tax=Pseudopedobacter beijingensis TaxID=1207056 RepID=A0ABW4IJ70_9SPHI
MKKIAILLVFVFVSCLAFAQKADDAVGIWYNAQKDAKIEIFKKGSNYFGKIVWLQNPSEDGKPKKDTKNPSESLRNREIIGLEILNNFNATGKNVLENGTIYDPKSGKTYSCKITVETVNKLNVRGFIGVSLIGRTDVWTRVSK